MRLESTFPRVEPPASDFDKRAFCEHFPGAFRDAEAEVVRLAAGVHEVTTLMAGISQRLGVAAGSGAATMAADAIFLDDASAQPAPAPAPHPPAPSRVEAADIGRARLR